MTAKERDNEISHWEKVIQQLEKKCEKSLRICGCLDSDDRQQIAYAEHRIEQIREEWRKSNKTRPTDSGQPARALSLICLLFIFAGLASCNTEPVTRSGYPVVNELTTAPADAWKLTGASISETARSLAYGDWGIDKVRHTETHSHFYYRKYKGDSTRHIIVYAGRVVSGKRAAN